MKLTAKITALLLITVTLLFPVMMLCASAEETTDLDSYVFYTDLFWGYSSEYLKEANVNGSHQNPAAYTLKEYSNKTGTAIINAYNCYINESPKYKWTVVKEAIDITTDPVKWFHVVSSDQGMDYTYDNALRSASERFAKSILSVSENMETGWQRMTAGEKILDKTEGIFKAFENLEGTYDLSKLTEKEIYTKVFEAVKSSNVLKYLKADKIDGVLKDVLKNPGEWAETAETAADIYNMAKCISMGLLFEDTRLEIINDFIAELPSDSIMRQGLTDFMNSIDGGFVEYFMKNYCKDKFLEELSEGIVKLVTKDLFGDASKAYALVNSCLKVASWVLFDVVFDVPDLGELTELYVLYLFTGEMHTLINSKLEKFDTSFSASDVLEFEVLVKTFFDLTYDALEMGEEMIYGCSYATDLKIIRGNASGASYERYISNTKADISAIPEADRNIKKVDLYYNNTIKFSGASDKVTPNTVYYFKHYYRGDIIVKYPYNLTVKEDQQLRIDGNIIVGKEYSGELFSSHVYSELKNNGTIICTGDLTVHEGGYNCGRYIQSDSKARLFIEGNMDFGYYTNQTCKITAGEVVFNGYKVQTVNGLTAHDVTVTNPEGIKYASDTYITGHFDLRGNPLDFGEFYTKIYSTTTFADGSDYKELRLGSSTVRLSGKVKGNITTLSTQTLIVNKNSTLIVDGNITLGKEYNGEVFSYPAYSTLQNNGTLICTGDLTVCEGGYNCGKYVQSDSSARLYIEGNLDFGYYTYKTCKITAGSVILSGSKLQTIYSLPAPTIIIENSSDEGVIFASTISPSVLFNHNGNKYTLYNNGKGSVFVDYDGDGLKDNTDSYPASVYNNGIFGDVNRDNVFSNADITIVIRLLSGWGMGDIPEYMADADANRKYNNRDAIALIRKLAGWDF